MPILRRVALFTLVFGAVVPAGAHPTTPGTVAVFAARQSTNWSGYNQGALDHALFRSVAGDWIVPTATQHTAGRAENSAAWIGIGGGCLNASCLLTDNTLIQAGTFSDVSSSGAASYAAWFELIPAPALEITSFTVRPGDHMHSAITESAPGVWNIVINDITNGGSYSITVPYSSTYGSAEWILETPIVAGTGGAGLAALPNLGTVRFTNATANGAAANLKAADAMVLVDGAGKAIATPSTPGVGGTSFNVCTYSSTCAAP